MQILLTDEVSFIKSCISNIHNEYVYADENSYATKVTHYQHEFKMDVSTKATDNYIIESVIITNRINLNNHLKVWNTQYT